MWAINITTTKLSRDSTGFSPPGGTGKVEKAGKVEKVGKVENEPK